MQAQAGYRHVPWMSPRTHETCRPLASTAHMSSLCHALPSRRSSCPSFCPMPLLGTSSETQRRPSPHSPLPPCASPLRPPFPSRAWICAECPVCRRSSCGRLLPFASHMEGTVRERVRVEKKLESVALGTKFPPRHCRRKPQDATLSCPCGRLRCFPSVQRWMSAILSDRMRQVELRDLDALC